MVAQAKAAGAGGRCHAPREPSVPSAHRGDDTMSPTDIVRINLERLLENDGRSVSALARDADAKFPGRGAGAWRKGILRTKASWWPTPWVAEGLAWLFGVELETIFTRRRGKKKTARARGARRARGTVRSGS